MAVFDNGNRIDVSALIRNHSGLSFCTYANTKYRHRNGWLDVASGVVDCKGD